MSTWERQRSDWGAGIPDFGVWTASGGRVKERGRTFALDRKSALL
jgi:hypothetical protein